jgi:hypothetical protein
MEDQRPIHTISNGTVRACIWRNASAKKLFHDVTFFRSYRKGDGWGTSSSFGAKELPLLATTILDAHAWIHNQIASHAEATATDAPGPATAESPGDGPAPG